MRYKTMTAAEATNKVKVLKAVIRPTPEVPLAVDAGAAADEVVAAVRDDVEEGEPAAVEVDDAGVEDEVEVGLALNSARAHRSLRTSK